MNCIGRAFVAGALVALVGSAALGQQPAPAVRTHDPALAACAALLDLVYLPLHLTANLVTGFAGGFVGFITLGDRAAAESIWELSNGSQIITPDMLAGTEPFHWTGYD